MALMDAVADEADNSDETDGLDDSSGDSGGLEDLGSLSDRLYDQSFGPGSFKPNEFGGRTFTPQSAIDDALKAQQDQQFKSLGLDNSSNEGFNQPASSPAPQIRNLKQLGAVAKALKGVPDEIRNRILSHLLGKPYQDPQQLRQQQRQEAFKNALKVALARHQLGQPDRQAAEARRQESLQQREKYQGQLVQLRKRQQAATEENRKAQLGQHREGAKTTLANSIANLTRAMGMTNDPEQQTQLGKVLLKQHQLYDQLATFEDKLNEKEVDKANDQASTGQGETY